MTLLRATSEGVCGGMIVETEGYLSAIDPAAHGYLRPTPRTRIMYGPPGYAYIYFSYGLHCCLNISTEPEGVGAAVLIRAIEPTVGVDLMRRRRGVDLPLRDLARGPGRVCAALGLTLAENGLPLTGETLWLDDEPGLAPDAVIATSPRIGISAGTEREWRWYLARSPYVSGPRSANHVVLSTGTAEALDDTITPAWGDGSRLPQAPEHPKRLKTQHSSLSKEVP